MSDIPIIRVPNHSWPFSEDNAARLELVYSLNTKLGGREPTTRAVFRGVTARELYLLEMDWLSLPRLVPGRIFSESPHVSEGKQSGQESATTVSPNSVEILTLRDAQSKLDSSSLHNAFEQDKSLPETKVFHWYDEKGAEYWLPVIEFIRKLFVRSPEMARAIIMYDGWERLVEGFTLYESTLEISLTKYPQVGDVHHLSLLAAKPSLLDAWISVSTCLSQAGSGATIDLDWPFVEQVTLHFTAKQKGNQFWIQELIDVTGINIPFDCIIPHHPGYVNKIYDGERTREGESKGSDVSEGDELTEAIHSAPVSTIESQQRSSAKVYMHIQAGSLSDFKQIKVIPEYNDISEKSIKIDSSTPASNHAKRAEESIGVEGCLTDAISMEGSEVTESTTNIYTKCFDDNQLTESNLKEFVKAINHMIKALGDKSELSWVVRERLLEKPENCGSRWFLKIDNEIGRSWCMACVSYEGKKYYFLEVGRGSEETKFSLSTLLLTDLGSTTRPTEWVEKMIENNGHWDTSYFKQDGVESNRLHHQYKSSNAWGKYFSRQVRR